MSGDNLSPVSLDGLIVRDEEGRVVIQLALVATLYFEHGHSLAKRQAVARCFREYREMTGDNLRWVHPGRQGFAPIHSASIYDPGTRLVDSDLDENAGWEFFWHGGKTAEDANHFKISGLGTRKWESANLGALSFLTFALPINFFVNHDSSFPGLIRRFCEQIKPVHGYGGFGLVESPNRFRSLLHESEVYALARRHTGLEIDYPIIHSLSLKGGIKGVNWVTVLGERLLFTIGGTNTLRTKLEFPAVVEDLQEGALVLAGPYPQLGDVNLGLAVTFYGPVSRALKQIRVKAHPRVHSTSPFDKDAFEGWLGRFDAL